MKLQTTVDIKAPAKLIDYQSQLLLIGSCFTENIGKQLQLYKLPTLLNPCGIAYNPISVTNSIKFLTNKKKLSDADCIFHNEFWHSLHHHGTFSRKHKKDLLVTVNQQIAYGQKILKKATHIFITLGTTWVFQHIATKQIINNCHKLPARDFKRQKLSLQKTIAALEEIITEIRNVNTTIEIVFTVSPIRHQKDGLHENQLNKASLLLAIEEIQQKYAAVMYFPAYELAIDELRDYRFFAADFCHLNDLGTQYIWERFCESYINKESQTLFPVLQKLQKALQHKVNKPESAAYQNFTKKTEDLLTALERKLPQVDFSVERKKLQNEYERGN